MILSRDLSTISLVTQIKEFTSSRILVINPDDLGRIFNVAGKFFAPQTIKDLFRITVNNAMLKRDEIQVFGDQGWSLLWKLDL